MKNTKLYYLYRDASNWKVKREIVFAGEITDEEETNVHNHLVLDNDFLPSQVGLKALQPLELSKRDDHIWHELSGFDLTTEKPSVSISIHDFVKRFVETEWNEETAIEEL